MGSLGFNDPAKPFGNRSPVTYTILILRPIVFVLAAIGFGLVMTVVIATA